MRAVKGVRSAPRHSGMLVRWFRVLPEREMKSGSGRICTHRVRPSHKLLHKHRYAGVPPEREIQVGVMLWRICRRQWPCGHDISHYVRHHGAT